MEFGQNRFVIKMNLSEDIQESKITHVTLQKERSYGPRKLVKTYDRLYISKNIQLRTTEHLIPDLVESEVMQHGFHVTYRVQQRRV